MRTFDKFVTSDIQTITRNNYGNYGCCKTCNRKWDNELCNECFDNEECVCDDCSWLNEDTHKCEHN